MADDTPFSLADLRGGINNSDSPTLLGDNQVVDARNVDLRDGALGAKRRGTTAISMTSAIFDSAVIALIRHTPTNLVSGDELWGIDSNGHVDRRVAGVWQGGVARANDFVVVNAANYTANGASLHGKLFLAAAGSQDRLLVWDGTVLRWAGIAQPTVPGVADTAVAGTYAGIRYVRIRYTAQSAGVTLRRSEPSTAVTFTPVGTKNGMIITKPAGTEATTSVRCEGQTHWEVELSLDNTLFYRVATVAIGTATYTDTTAYATGYAANTLSEAIGEYVPPGSARYVGVDEDRIMLAGSHTYAAEDSTVWWTPVTADDGVGNDERLPTATEQFLRFDGLDGGSINGFVAGEGNVLVLKRSRVHTMTRTGEITGAYVPNAVSRTRGCLPGCAVSGTDVEGVPCVYFLDPNVGLCRYGQHGIEDRLGYSVRVTWRTRNKKATINPRMVYYPDLEQVWYSVPTGSATVPDLLFMHESRYGSNWFHDGVPAIARAMAIFPNTTTETLRPVIGTVSTASSYVHEADLGVNDSGTSFLGYVTTKPYVLGSLWQKFGLMAMVLLAKAVTSTTIRIRMIRNFGIETRDVTADLTPSAAGESRVIRPIDNGSMSELNTIQMTYGDSAASDQAWSLDQLACRVRSEEGSA